MTKQNEKMDLSEETRLITEREKKIILERYNNRNKIKYIVLLYGIVLVITGGFWGVISKFGGFKIGARFFAGLNFIFLYFAVYTAINSKKIVKQIKLNELFVREAIFIGSNKYHNATFEIMKKGKRELYFRTVSLNDKVKKGDKVILIEVKGIDWVYKASE